MMQRGDDTPTEIEAGCSPGSSDFARGSPSERKLNVAKPDCLSFAEKTDV